MNRMYQVACIAMLVWALSVPHAQSQTSTFSRDPYVDGLCLFGADIGYGWEDDLNPGEDAKPGALSQRITNLVDDKLDIVQYQLSRGSDIVYAKFWDYDIIQNNIYQYHPFYIVGDTDPYLLCGTWYAPAGIVNAVHNNASTDVNDKVLLTFPFNSKHYRSEYKKLPGETDAEYENYLRDKLAGAQAYSPYDTRAKLQYSIYAREALKHVQAKSDLNRIFAIELGAEQESDNRWLDNASSDPQTTWFGSFHEGEKWAEMHIAVKEELRQHSGLCDIDIIGGGSIQSHTMLHEDYAYDPAVTQAYFPEDLTFRRNGCSREFLEGFVSRIYDYNNQTTYNVLPEYIGIHGFIGYGNPEGYDDLTTDPQKPKTYTSKRLQELIDICDEATGSSTTHSNWIPDFCVTDYCFAGGDYGNGEAYSPSNGASEITQAVYFLRAQLIFATSRGEYKNNYVTKYVGWSACSYYHHTFSSSHDCGFFNYVPSGSNSSSRIVRKISKHLCEPASGIELNELSTLGLHLRQGSQGTDKLAGCGWRKSNGDVVFAVWRFNESDNYYDPTPDEREIYVLGDFENDYNLIEAKKFKIDNTSTVFENLVIGTETEVEYLSLITRISVQVDENPVFLVFEQI